MSFTELHAALERVMVLIEALREKGDSPDLQEFQAEADRLAAFFHARFVQCSFMPLLDEEPR